MFNRQVDGEERRRAGQANATFRQTLFCRQALEDVSEHAPVRWAKVNGNVEQCDLNDDLPDDEPHRTEFFLPDLDIVVLLTDHIKAFIDVLAAARLPNRVPPTSPRWSVTGTIAYTSLHFVVPAVRRQLSREETEERKRR